MCMRVRFTKHLNSVGTIGNHSAKRKKGGGIPDGDKVFVGRFRPRRPMSSTSGPNSPEINSVYAEMNQNIISLFMAISNFVIKIPSNVILVLLNPTRDKGSHSKFSCLTMQLFSSIN